MMKALSDKTRFTILEMLLLRRYCVGGLARTLHISEAAVSQHLKILKTSGLVKGTKSGYFMRYEVEREALKVLAGNLLRIVDTESNELFECQTREQKTCKLCNENHRIID